MATERHFDYCLVTTVLVCSLIVCWQPVAIAESAKNGSDVILAAKIQCMSRCGLAKKFDEAGTWRHYLNAPQELRDSTCYRNCIKKIKNNHRGLLKIKERSRRGASICPPTKETTEQKLGDIQNISVTFLQRETRYGMVTWIANVTWDIYFLNKSMYNTDEWKGYIIIWIDKKPSNEVVITENSCRFIFKNSTNFIIESGSSDWVYPNAIEIAVLVYPPTKDNENGDYDMFTFDPKSKEKNTTVTTAPTKSATTIQNSSRDAFAPLELSRILAIIFGCFCGVLVVCGVLYLTWKMKNKPTTSPRLKDQDCFDYDASILYSSKDEEWVTTELIPLLETQNHFKCFIHFRDFTLGKVLHENIADAIYKCRKNIAVVSKHFLGSNYCKEELDMALDRVQRCRDYSLIVVNLDGVSLDQLPAALRIRTFVNLANLQEEKTWRNRLVKQISLEEDNQRSNNGKRTIQPKTFLRVTSKGCQVISHINDFSTSSTESVL